MESPYNLPFPAQAFRHLYVLAAQPRSVQAIDVDSLSPVHVPLEVTLRSSAVPGAPTRVVGRPGAAQARPMPATPAFVTPSNGEAAWGGRTREQGGQAMRTVHGAAAGQPLARDPQLTLERTAPCLLPEKDQVRSSCAFLVLISVPWLGC